MENSVTYHPFEFIKTTLEANYSLAVNIAFENNNQDKPLLTINNNKVKVYTIKQAYPNTIVTLFNDRPTDEISIVVADYISPQAKEELRKRNINYIDSAENLYLEMDSIHIHFERLTISPSTSSYKYRAFTKTGAMVVYQFLINPELVNAPQRQIAKKANVSLGTIPKVIAELKKEGFLISTYGRKMELIDKERLLEKWIDVLDTKILPAQFMQDYALPGREITEYYKNNNFDSDTFWGGEPGASVLTNNYLRPQYYTIFTSLTQQDLIRKYKLIPQEGGEIKVYQKFWTANLNNDSNGHPILIYAQLMASRDDRNRETAELIYNEYIHPNL